MSQPIIPFTKKVFVTLLSEEERLQSGLVVERKEETRKGRVVASAIEGLQADDVIYFKHYAGSKINEDQIILEDTEVLAYQRGTNG